MEVKMRSILMTQRQNPPRPPDLSVRGRLDHIFRSFHHETNMHCSENEGERKTGNMMMTLAIQNKKRETSIRGNVQLRKVSTFRTIMIGSIFREGTAHASCCFSYSPGGYAHTLKSKMRISRANKGNTPVSLYHNHRSHCQSIISKNLTSLSILNTSS